MPFLTAIKICFRKYFVFSGRARRSEYWWFFLFTSLVTAVFGFLDSVLFPPIWEDSADGMRTSEVVMAALASDRTPLSDIFSLLTLVPSVSVGGRRLHDLNRSGWWQAVPLGTGLGVVVLSNMIEDSSVVAVTFLALAIVCFVSCIVLLIWMLRDGERADNRFGPSPKYGSQAAVFD